MKAHWIIAMTIAILAIAGFSREPVVYAGDPLDNGHDWVSVDDMTTDLTQENISDPFQPTQFGDEEFIIRPTMFIPEPATLAILGFGAAALLRRKK